MKKIFVLCVAVMLALPAMSYAGSATSRWDLTIGGMVKMDYNYSSQAINQDITNAERQTATVLNPPNNAAFPNGAVYSPTSSRDRYGASSWGSGESRLNFLVKGPDTWGAKTSAFIEFDFRSMTSNSVSAATRNSVEDYGLANLRHAFMKFDWPTFSLVIGRTWSVPGNQPCFCLLGVNEIGSFNKGIIAEQIYGVWQATKQFSVTGGIMNPANPTAWPGGSVANGVSIDDGFQRSNWPMIFSELLYKTDACGKIGPWMLQFGVGGVYGQEKPIEPADLGPAGNIGTQGGTSGSSLNTVSNPNIAGVTYLSPNGYASNNVNMWMLTFKSFIPIIPEKAPGKLANSLGMSLTAFTGQDMRRFAGATPFIQATYAYDRALLRVPTGTTFVPGAGSVGTQLVTPNADYHAPVNTGGWAQLMYYWTDTLWTGVYYGQNRTSLSQTRKGVSAAGSGSGAFGVSGVAGPMLNGNATGASNPIAASAGAIERQQEWHVNLVYDPNPAIRMGLEYSWTESHYARNLYLPGVQALGTTTIGTGGLTSNGVVSSLRFSAAYFF